MEDPDISIYSPLSVNRTSDTRDIESGSNIENKIKSIEKDLQTLKTDYNSYKWYYNWLVSFMESLIVLLYLKVYNVI